MMGTIRALKIYMAGPVVENRLARVPYEEEGDVKTEFEFFSEICRWREIIFESKHGDQEPGTIYYKKPVTLSYAGPTITSIGHGVSPGTKHTYDENYTDDKKYRGELVQRCLRQIRECDVVFVWIDRENTVGTIVEVTAACFYRKNTYIVFETAELAEHFYFITYLSNVDFIVGTLDEGWRQFMVYVRQQWSDWCALD